MHAVRARRRRPSWRTQRAHVPPQPRSHVIELDTHDGAVAAPDDAIGDAPEVAADFAQRSEAEASVEANEGAMLPLVVDGRRLRASGTRSVKRAMIVLRVCRFGGMGR